MATVHLQYDNLPKGKQVEVTGLGLLKNGEANEVDDQRFRLAGYKGDTLTLGTEAARQASTEQREQEEEEVPVTDYEEEDENDG